MRTLIGTVALVGLLQAGPVILSRGDIGDNYYDTPPAEILERNTWLGLFIEGGRADQKPRNSRLAATSVSFARRKEPGPTVYRLLTKPPGAELLLSGVPRLSPGPVATVAQAIDFGGQRREAEFRLGGRQYRIRLDSKAPNYCDGVIILTEGERSQKLFDAADPGVTNDPALVVACDEPHFTIHWAGDLDRDGRLDMLVTFSRKYSYHPRQLLLSSMARPGGLVAEAARYDTFARSGDRRVNAGGDGLLRIPRSGAAAVGAPGERPCASGSCSCFSGRCQCSPLKSLLPRFCGSARSGRVQDLWRRADL